jgi:hypothetical protein
MPYRNKDRTRHHERNILHNVYNIYSDFHNGLYQQEKENLMVVPEVVVYLVKWRRAE